MTRVIVHAGFHKTGTTSLQAFLAKNRKKLLPIARCYFRKRLGPAQHTGRWYGQWPCLPTRLLFRASFRRFLRLVPDHPVIVISRETYCGMILGGYGWRLRPSTRYAPTAIPLAREIVAGLKRRFGPGVQIEFLYTVRDTRSFQESLYHHHQKTGRMQDTKARFIARFPANYSLKDEGDQIAAAIAPVPVHLRSLESVTGCRLGPGQVIVDLLGIPEDRQRLLAAVPVKNASNPSRAADTQGQTHKGGATP